MATIQNERDKLLQAASARLQTVEAPSTVLSPSGRGLRVSASAQVFSVDKLGSPTPGAIALTAKLANFPPDQPVTWSVVSGSALLTGVAGASATLPYLDMVSPTVTVRASATYLGSVYAEEVVISKVYAGVDGVSPTLYAVKPSVTSLVTDALGRLNYTSLTVSGHQREGAVGTLATYAGRLKVTARVSGTLTTLYTSQVNESQATVNLPIGTKDVLVQLFRAGGLTEELDRSNVPVLEDGIDIDVQVESTNGTVFRVGQARQTVLVARVFRNGVDITDTVPASRFKWIRVSLDDPPPPHDDATWNFNYATGYKQVLVDVDQVFAKATFHCQIIE